jgi:hypothetical protein
MVGSFDALATNPKLLHGLALQKSTLAAIVRGIFAAAHFCREWHLADIAKHVADVRF